jgi:S-adenosylmethionine:diacylglycerol 3-amino-3-carboxypropyl transferase
LNEFDYKLHLSRAKSTKTRTLCKKELIHFFARANSNRNTNDYDTFVLDTQLTKDHLIAKVRNLKVARAYRDRYVELGGSLDNLSKIHQGDTLTFYVSLIGPIEEILELL